MLRQDHSIICALGVDAVRQLVADAERLVSDGIDYERRLTSLVARLENVAVDPVQSGRGTWTPDGSAVDPSSSPQATDALSLLAAVRQLCVAARSQRQLAQSVLGRLSGEGEVRPGSHPLRVLVVDDSADNRDVVAAVLEASGFRAITACNGLECVIVAHCERPNVILMDLTMPVLDGIEAARLLKASAATRHINVVAHTATPEFYVGPLGRLFVDVLPKPATPDSIVASVRRFAADNAAATKPDCAS